MKPWYSDQSGRSLIFILFDTVNEDAAFNYCSGSTEKNYLFPQEMKKRNPANEGETEAHSIIVETLILL